MERRFYPDWAMMVELLHLDVRVTEQFKLSMNSSNFHYLE